MKKLYILKPDIKTGYLNGGRGQEVTYLNVPTEIDRKSLEKDVKNGAAMFQSLLDFTQKKQSRFVIINCDNMEEGMTAVSYLAAIYNDADGVSCAAEDNEEEICEERMFDLDLDDIEWEEPQNWEEKSEWEETAWKIPVISYSEIITNNNFPSYFGSNAFSNNMNWPGQTPYWYHVRREPVIIKMDCTPFDFFGGERMGDVCRRFENNRHIYLIRPTNSRVTLFDEDNDDTGKLYDENLFGLILEYSASCVDVYAKEEDRCLYHELLFKNWIDYHGYKTTRSFPFKKLIKTIDSFRNPDKSNLMDRIVRYLDKDERESNILKEKDFDFIRSFLRIPGQEEKVGIEKFSAELVGMDSVKKKIFGIVEVMRYYKRREELGLKSEGFHNVHMMLGAPGTAKTTVAKLLGRIMEEEHLLEGSRFTSINGAELKGMYVGHTAPKVKQLFENNDIILIDEAYALTSNMGGEMDIFAQEALSQLMVELEQHGMDRLVIFAGYGGDKVSEEDNRMKQFLQANPGIRSRINTTIFFDSYTPEQMLDIFMCHVKKNQFTVDAEAKPLVLEFFQKRVSEPDFGNGREARSLLENSCIEAAQRLSKVSSEKLTSKMMQELTAEDVGNAIDSMSKAFSAQKGRGTKACYGF